MAASFKYLQRGLRYGVLAVLGAAAVMFFGGNSQATERTDLIAGSIRVIDGDSFEVAGTKIRLHGIDAPETDQICQTEQGADWACGGWITRAVADRYTGEMASCKAIELDRYGRTVARCTALGSDVGAWLVGEGMAFAYVQYSDDYIEIEREAAAVDRGLHAVRMQTPSQHRRRDDVATTLAQGTCNIKGNITAKGVKIYHVPGQEYYTRTRINVAKGERWFCSEAAARAAGWRKSKV